MRLVKLNKKIVLEDVGDIVKVYNGKKYVILRIKESMLLHYIGEFILTKKLGSSIHRMKTKKEIKKSKKK